MNKSQAEPNQANQLSTEPPSLTDIIAKIFATMYTHTHYNHIYWLRVGVSCSHMGSILIGMEQEEAFCKMANEFRRSPASFDILRLYKFLSIFIRGVDYHTEEQPANIDRCNAWYDHTGELRWLTSRASELDRLAQDTEYLLDAKNDAIQFQNQLIPYLSLKAMAAIKVIKTSLAAGMKITNNPIFAQGKETLPEEVCKFVMSMDGR